MKVEIFEPTKLVEDNVGEIRIDTYMPQEVYLEGDIPTENMYKTDYYHVNVIVEQQVVDLRSNREDIRLIKEGYTRVRKPDSPPYHAHFEKVRKIVIQDPMVNALLEKQNIKQDGYLTQNLGLQRENRYIENKLKAECIRAIKTRDKIRKMSFIDRVFRWKKIAKEIMEM